MEENEMKQIISEIESKLTGDAEKDAEIWNEYGERYREVPGSEELQSEIARRIFALAPDADDEFFADIYNDMLKTTDEDFAEACRLIDRQQYDEALEKLFGLCDVIRFYVLSEDTVWMDFDSFLDSLVFLDLYQEEIGNREIGRHPIHPSRILFTTGLLLIEMGRAEEAVDILKTLIDFDPVCPRFLFELGEAYKRTGQYKEAAQNALWSLKCAHTRADLARGYRDLAYCLSETGSFEDAVMLYMQSLHFEPSRQAQSEIAWIRKKTGISADGYNDEAIQKRCEELDIPTGISETVISNQELLKMIGQSD